MPGAVLHIRIVACGFVHIPFQERDIAEANLRPVGEIARAVFNEAIRRPEFQALEELAREIHKIDPRVKVFCNPAAFGPDDRQALMKLADDIAIWSPHFLIFAPGDNTGWPKKFSEADKKEALRGFFAEELPTLR